VRSRCHWPDKDEHLLEQYAYQLRRGEWAVTYCRWLRRFQRFVCKHSRSGLLTKDVFHRWIKTTTDKSGVEFVIRHTYVVKGFLDWLVAHGHLGSHPLAELQKKYQCHSLRGITRALMKDDPDPALEA
jgi:hypothetical protein